MKAYRGERTIAGPLVMVNGEPLPPRNDLHNHSPNGFEWGYGGSGPAQLALAILADYIGGAAALKWYQRFKWNVIAGLRDDKWTLTESQINEALAALKREADGETNHRP